MGGNRDDGEAGFAEDGPSRLGQGMVLRSGNLLWRQIDEGGDGNGDIKHHDDENGGNHRPGRGADRIRHVLGGVGEHPKALMGEEGNGNTIEDVDEGRPGGEERSSGFITRSPARAKPTRTETLLSTTRFSTRVVERVPPRLTSMKKGRARPT